MLQRCFKVSHKPLTGTSSYPRSACGGIQHPTHTVLGDPTERPVVNLLWYNKPVDLIGLLLRFCVREFFSLAGGQVSSYLGSATPQLVTRNWNPGLLALSLACGVTGRGTHLCLSFSMRSVTCLPPSDDIIEEENNWKMKKKSLSANATCKAAKGRQNVKTRCQVLVCL